MTEEKHIPFFQLESTNNEEKPLSEKIIKPFDDTDEFDMYDKEDVAQAVERLKNSFGYDILTGKAFHYNTDMILKEIDEIFGDLS